MSTLADIKEDKHINLILRGSKVKAKFFHALIRECDRDWPFKDGESLLCKICHGGIYKRPRFSPMMLKALAAQINALPNGNLKLKIKDFTPARKCFDIAVKQLGHKI
jgi:hypothetical protein